MTSDQQVSFLSPAVDKPLNLSSDPDHIPTASQALLASSTMPYNCQICVRRKIKCDRNVPVCSACVKSAQDCFYQAPPKPRRKKRKGAETEEHVPEEDIHDRLARYERILRKNGLLDTDGTTTPGAGDAEKSSPSSRVIHPDLPVSAPESRRLGKLLASGGKSRYIDSNLWLDAGVESMHNLWLETGEEGIQDSSDDAESSKNATTSVGLMPGYDPISGALLGYSHDLLELHPSHDDAMKLWATHVQNVEPICKILHIPTTAKMVETVSRQPSTATKAQECQLFAIYHFAVYSMNDEDCLRQFGRLRAVLLPKYSYAMRQALVNASWLKTTEMPVLQAYMLFLIGGRGYLDPHTFWMMTGVAVRIAQRMGLHRDGETLGLPPFEVQMRRRLFWQLIPLEGFAGQHSGTGICMPPSSWDIKKPMNINDDQIYPGMTQQPEEQKGATDMFYCLARAELSEYYSKTARMQDGHGPSFHLRSAEETMALIDKVEEVFETKFLRYCDIINPIHYLVVIVCRSAINVVRLRNRIMPLKSHNIGDADRRELCALAQRILDSDNAIYRHPGLQKFRWQVKEFFLWDALICILTSLAKPGFFSRAELESTWVKMADVLAHHPELLSTERPVHVSAGKAILEAWTANPLGDADPEPNFITTLRSRSSKNKKTAADKATGEATNTYQDSEQLSLSDEAFAGINGTGINMNADYSPGVGDWVFWDQFFLNAGPGPG